MRRLFGVVFSERRDESARSARLAQTLALLPAASTAQFHSMRG